MNIILLIGAALGLTSVMMAAFIDHSLATLYSGKLLNGLYTAVRYHQLYAILITIFGLSLPLIRNEKMRSSLRCSTLIFMTGIILFSFSIYLAAVTGLSSFTYLTPVGGILLMAGWVSLLRVATMKP
tara:strand:+ start:411 stop:791 length:381 start_codon:yes stop_codon:yes gene_type:complete